MTLSDISGSSRSLLAMNSRPSSAATTFRPVPLPRAWPVRGVDVVAVLAAQAVIIGVMWLRHGGLDEVGTAGGLFTAIGQLTALYGTYLALIQLVLMSRSPWLDQSFGMDRLAVVHRWLGFATVWLLLGHVVGTTVGWSIGDGQNVVGEFLDLVTTYPYVLMATASAGLFALVAISSIRAARRRISRETWYGLHLYAYLAIALGFLHQLFVGSDFIHDQVASIYWIGLYVATIALILVFRIGQPIATSMRHRLRVANVVREGPGVISLYVTGDHLDELAVRAGQYFQWRFLTRDGWWRAHPFSISSAPNGRWLRVTIKELGDWSGQLQQVGIGTRIFIEGPYGVMTGARRRKRRVLLIAGGIGITPLRALVEALPGAPGDLALIYRVRRPSEIVFREELETLARERGIALHLLIGQRGSRAMPDDPLTARALITRIPDIADRDIYLCAPVAMMQSVEASLDDLRVPKGQIHAERFAY
jgi:predicted ferric reductase